MGLAQGKGKTCCWLAFMYNFPNARKHSEWILAFVFVSVSFDGFSLKNASRLANSTAQSVKSHGWGAGCPTPLEAYESIWKGKRVSSNIAECFFWFIQFRGGMQVCKGEKLKKNLIIISLTWTKGSFERMEIGGNCCHWLEQPWWSSPLNLQNNLSEQKGGEDSLKVTLHYSGWIPR